MKRRKYLPGAGHEGHPGDRALVSLEPVESALVDDVPDDEGGVLGAGDQPVTFAVEGQARHGRFVAVEGHGLLGAAVKVEHSHAPVPAKKTDRNI